MPKQPNAVASFFRRSAIKVVLFTLYFALYLANANGAAFAGSWGRAAGFAVALLALQIVIYEIGGILIAWLSVRKIEPLQSRLGLIAVLAIWCVLPALELKLLATMFPRTIAFAGWSYIFKCSILLLAITTITRYRGVQ